MTRPPTAARDTRNGDAGRSLPTGTVTFLRSDVEGSMTALRALGDRWDDVNLAQLTIIGDEVGANGGVVIRTEGDGLFAAFGEAAGAVAAAAGAQRNLAAAVWPAETKIRVRMGLHTGEAHLSGDDYGGFDVNRAARVAATGHGGQVILSETTATLVADSLPADTVLRDLGRHVLKDVPRAERLSQLDIAGLPSDFPPLRTNEAVVGDLPDRLTSFVGRETLLASVVELVRDIRLVTLTGPGGIGKSSLAVEVARAVAPEFPDGAWFISLADVVDPSDFAKTVARGVGLRDGPERDAATALLPYLAERRMVLVLDNLEQLIDAADHVSSVIRSSPGSRVIVTSRAPLHLGGEHEVQVPPLTDDGVRLFVERVQATKPGWDPDDDLPVVAEICAMLDHLPLGIELAAARAAMLPPAAIRDRLANRLPLPGQGPRDAPERQRTLVAAVAWSHDLLPEPLQKLLQDLSVFEGGFDVEQVEVVADGAAGGERLDDLLELADRSLIVPDATGGDRPRFRMLRTIQSFAIDRLIRDGRAETLRARHAHAYLDLAAWAFRRLNTFEHTAALDRMAPEAANEGAAMRFAMGSGDAEVAMQLVDVMWRFWHAQGLLADGGRIAEAVLAMPGGPREGIVRARACGAAGSIAYWQGDMSGARSLYEEQVRLSELADDDTEVAEGLFNLMHVLFLGGDDDALQLEFIDDLERRYRDLGDERGVGRIGWSRALLAINAGRADEAMELLTASRDEFERIGDPQYRAMSTASLAWAAFTLGDLPMAVHTSADGLQESFLMRDLGTTTISLHIGVLIAVMAGRFEDAAMVLGAFEGLCERFGVRPPAALEHFIKSSDPVAATRAALEPASFDASYERGRRLSYDEAVALVLDLASDLEASYADAAKSA